MDNVGGRASWNNAPYNHTTLRQPNINCGVANTTDPNPSSSNSQSRQHAGLSIDAPEFVPRFKTGGSTISSAVQPMIPFQDPAIIHQSQSYHPNHLPQHHHPSQFHPQHHNINPHMQQHQQNTMAMISGPKSSVQNRLHLSGGGSGGSGRNNEFNGGDMYGQVVPNQHQSQQPLPADPLPTEKEIRALNYLSEVMKKLTDNPGMFEDIQHHLTNMFSDYSSNEYVMSNALEMIFELSVDEQNFRYMGARICRLLDCIEPRPDSLFRRFLCLKIDHHQSLLQQFILSNEKRKLRGTTLFLAELYMQMQNDGARIMKIAESIVSAMLLLLENVGPENVKCICQALKLCGYELEIDRQMDINSILQKLQNLEESLDVSTGRLLNSVLDLKAKCWGRTEPVIMAPILEPIRQDYNDVPVFYGPDGQVLTDEENSFLLSNYPPVNIEEFDDYNDPDELVEAEPEMDLEIQMAFKDFVRSAKNQQL